MTSKESAFAELKYGRIHLYFPYRKDAVLRVRQLPGAHGNKKEGAFYWSLPLDLQTGREINRIFPDLQLSPKLKKWARKNRVKERRLKRLVKADYAELERLPKSLPLLFERIYVGPQGRAMSKEQFAEALTAPHGSYQTADVAYLAANPNPLNANQPGLGKTYEAIAAIYEAGLENGSHIVVAPKTAIEVVWGPTLRDVQSLPVYEATGCYCPERSHTGTSGREHRLRVIDQFLADSSPGKWLIVNPEMLRLVKTPKKIRVRIVIKQKIKQKIKDNPSLGPIMIANPKGDCRCKPDGAVHFHYEYAFPILQSTKWTTVINDECHKGNVRNHKTPTAKGIVAVKAESKLIDMSGTPMKGLGVDIWGIFNHLNPEKYSDFWGFAKRFFEINSNGHGSQIGKLRSDARKEFFDYIEPDLLRRTKAECAPWLPPIMHIDEDVSMEGKQLKQYEKMHEDGVYRLGQKELSTTSILAEMMRMTQFAISYWAEKDGKFLPTMLSCKVDRTLDILDEHGIFRPGDSKVVIFSQFRTVVEMVAAHLKKNKVPVDLLTGKLNKRGQRQEFQQEFQNGKTRVACVVTTAGGVAIDLDQADTAIRLDESYAPDDDTQADDRLHRVSRIHQVTIHTIRTKNTIDALRQSIKEEKHSAHIDILDIRRRLLEESF